MRGLVPEGAKRGAVIVIFIGVETPFLLRPMPGNDNKFRLLGGAFVEDCMKGEKTSGENVKQRNFVLC